MRRKFWGKVVDAGSRIPVAITILVKHNGVKKDRFIHYHDIGDYLSREQKLAIIAEFGDISAVKWSFITPNENNDWINQRNQSYANFIALGDKKKQEQISIYLDNYASGLSTNRDVWVYSYSAEQAKMYSERMIAFYNSERKRCFAELKQQQEQGIISSSDKKAIDTYLTNIRSMDATKISWSAGLTTAFCRNFAIEPTGCVRLTSYRPFCKKFLVYNKDIIERPSKWDSILPDDKHENFIICVSGSPIKKNFSVLITDTIQDLNFMEHSICFPMYIYDQTEKHENVQMSLFGNIEEDTAEYKKRYAISDVALARFRNIYGDRITKEDIFYYLYAVLHSRDYISAYEDNLAKEMVRIPMLEKFPKYVEIGRKLAELHLNYETPVDADSLGLDIAVTKEDYSVSKMRFKKVGKDSDKSTIIFNDYIMISNIPERAYSYVINGRSAIEWIMESYRIKTDKDSGITDDPNTYGDEKYIFNLLISIISVSLKTLDLIESMPEYKEI